MCAVHNPRVVQWRSLLARDRRRPAGFILPCQPVLSQQIPTGSEWIHELKWDGYRIIARREAGRVCLWSRNGRNWADAFLSIVAAVERLPIESVILDGEAVCCSRTADPTSMRCDPSTPAKTPA